MAHGAPPTFDKPFSTPSFAPPSLTPSPLSGDDMEFRPSFIGRLKRLFGKKRPPEF
jgi:hypothetical protein